MMTVCYFGSYNPDYSRNKILIDGLQKNGVSVLECRSTYGSFLKRYPELISKFLHIAKNIDVIVVGFVGHLDMPLAWLLARLTGKKVIFDMFYSMYDTYVYDRQSTRKGSLRAWIYFLIDKLAGTLADIVLTDTKAHGEYFIKTFNLNKKKFRRIFVGGDDTIFLQRRTRGIREKRGKKRNKIIIEFHGMFTRLHGAEYFVEAAKLLERKKNLEFWLIGSTSNYFLPLTKYESLRPKTMKYFPQMSVRELANKIALADISIAHLGTTKKAKSVITNKMFQALFCQVALIAGDCTATRELLTDKKDCLFAKMGDVKDLAQKIQFLAKSSRLRKQLAVEGYRLAKERLTNKELGRNLLKIIDKLVSEDSRFENSLGQSQ